jgi:hypothetical protein
MAQSENFIFYILTLHWNLYFYLLKACPMRHKLNTRSKNQFYVPTSNLSVFQKGLLVLGYFIDCQGPFKVVERIESVLKIIYFHISWITHFIQLTNFWSIQLWEQLTLNKALANHRLGAGKQPLLGKPTTIIIYNVESERIENTPLPYGCRFA